ncbi:Patronin [Phytophthora citrophthora]|uniref:Patronin n=1 Tax=Phytophthora citrophthora TaxID=4793 RepID=A0AAD9GQ48_9STRA|nr:Patronin [Phytophthora citrophthora]
MSKKKALSPTASLASCLDFAARVLSSTATVQEICTKQVLAPMVVEAHRCGQQVMKHVESGFPADVRKLIKVLQSDKGSHLCRGSPLKKLEVADLTWDGEGTVADTMEMELMELEKRAANAQHSCVIFSTSGGNGQAVIWFSFKRYGSWHRGSDPKNRQILLYVCPGRVKVVKTVDALITKLCEELPTLRVNGATYNVWTVVMGSKSSNQKEEHVVPAAPQLEVKTENVASNQCADEGQLNALDARNSVTPESRCESTNQFDEIARSTESRRSNVTPFDQETGVGFQLHATKEPVETVPESQDDKCDPVSPHYSAYRETSGAKLFSIKTIFSFGLQKKTSQELQRSSFEQNPSCFNAAGENEKGAIVLNPDTVNESENNSVRDPGVEVEPRKNNQIQDTRLMRAVVSASLSNFSALDKGSLQDDTALGLGINQQKGYVWQSCDGKVLRKTVGSQQLPPARDEPIGGKTQATAEADRAVEQLNAHAGVDEEVDDCTSGVLPSDEWQKPQDISDKSPQRTPSKVGLVDSKLDSPHIFLQVPSADQDLDDSQTSDSSQKSEIVMSVTASTKSTAPDSENVNDENANDEIGEPLQSNELLSGQIRDCGKTEDHFIASSEIIDDVDSMHRPKSAVNYKDKLGARIWWELAYTARRLEREEMMEKHQQALRRVGEERVKRQQPATSNLRRANPIRSKKDEQVKQQVDLTKPDGRNHFDQQYLGEVDTVGQQPANNYLDVPERSQSEISANSIKNEISPCKIPSPSPSREVSSDSSVDGVAEFVKSRPLSSPHILSGDSGRAVKHAEHSSGEKVVAGCPPPTISRVASRSPIFETYRSLDERRESKSAVRESLTSYVGQSSKPPVLAARVQEEDNDDETVAQMMWGSTHTSYERERLTNTYPTGKEDEQQTTDVTSKIPFSIRGRVPIRSRQVEAPARDERPTSSSTKHSPPSSNSDHIAREEESQDKQVPSRLRLSAYQASTDPKTQPVVPAQPPVATFIHLGEENSAASSGKTRQERLNELRQKKLQKLQQARDSSLQQQKYKQSQKTRQPLSFANSVYSKKASNRQLMQNALEFTLLAGGSMEKERLLALQALNESTCDNFIVLLKSAKELKFRALYESHVDRDYATRIYSVLPSTSARAPLKLANSEMISQFFKYSSAKKQFLPVPTRSFTVKTDACSLVDQLVFKKNSSSALSRLL